MSITMSLTFSPTPKVGHLSTTQNVNNPCIHRFFVELCVFFPPFTVFTRTGGGRTTLRWTAQNFALFFPLPLQISLFFFPLWGFLGELWPGLEAGDHPNSASLCETPVASWYFCFVPCVSYVPFVIFLEKLSRMFFFVPFVIFHIVPNASFVFVPNSSLLLCHVPVFFVPWCCFCPRTRRVLPVGPCAQRRAVCSTRKNKERSA